MHCCDKKYCVDGLGQAIVNPFDIEYRASTDEFICWGDECSVQRCLCNIEIAMSISDNIAAGIYDQRDDCTFVERPVHSNTNPAVTGNVCVCGDCNICPPNGVANPTSAAPINGNNVPTTLANNPATVGQLAETCADVYAEPVVNGGNNGLGVDADDDNQQTTTTIAARVSTVAPTGQMPFLMRMMDPILLTPPTTTDMYVDNRHGSDSYTGFGLNNAKKTIQNAVDEAPDGTTIYVLEGDGLPYRNVDFGTGNDENDYAVKIDGKSNVIITHWPGHRPKIEFDGAGGFSVTNSDNIVITGFDIQGPCYIPSMTEGEALDARINDPKIARFNGRGVVVGTTDPDADRDELDAKNGIITEPNSHHIRIDYNRIYNAPNAGVLVQNADYFTIINNEIYENTRCGSAGESGVVVRSPISHDCTDPLQDKIGIINNIITDNENRIPFYDPNYEVSSYLSDNSITVPRTGYGTAANHEDGFIVDGSGISISSKKDGLVDPYACGKTLVTDNEIVRSGTEAIKVDSPSRLSIRDNTLLWNGLTPRIPNPEARPNYAGINLPNIPCETTLSRLLEVYDNEAYVYHSDDQGYRMEFEDRTCVLTPLTNLQDGSQMNSLCGGDISSNFQDYVTMSGGNCGDDHQDELIPFLQIHEPNTGRTTDLPTTTLQTTLVFGQRMMTDTIVGDIENDCTENYMYVSEASGRDYYDGYSLDKPKQTMQAAIDAAKNGTTILVLNGRYTNSGYGSGSQDNGPLARIEAKDCFMIRPYPGHAPTFNYDGEGAFIMSRSMNIEIRGFDIEGPCGEKIEEELANAQRLQPTRYMGGIAIAIKDDSHHIRLNNNKVHDSSSSGIKATGTDYLSIINNEVYNNAHCSSDAGAGILIENPKPIDDEDITKIGVINNNVHDNFNQVPFYDPNYDDPQYLADNNIELPRPGYGSASNSDFIMDGAGIKIVTDDDYNGDQGLGWKKNIY